jgi:N-acetylneuraminate synthase
MSVFIIEEIGINHNGDLDIAKKLIDAAVIAGCDAVKFQKRTPDVCVPELQKSVMRDTPWGRMSYLDYRHRMEFGKNEFDAIDEYCKSRKMKWFASVWDAESLDFLESYRTGYYKIPSAMLCNSRLLQAVASAGEYTFISTGMSSMAEVDNAVRIFREQSCPFELMHCVSTYPMENRDANLKCIHTLQQRYGCRVGYSGHERGLQISLAAVALGASSIERHVTIDRTMFGSDQAASLEPSGLFKLVRDIRVIEKALGDGVKRVLESEKPVRSKLRGEPEDIPEVKVVSLAADKPA